MWSFESRDSLAAVRCGFVMNVLLIDDHALLRSGLRRILDPHDDIAVIGEAASGIEGIELARLHRPQVAVVDIAMKGLNGIDATAQILRACPETRVLILSMYADQRYVARAMNAGAAGYLLKDCVEDELVEAIRTVARGGRFLSDSLAPFASQARPPAAGDEYDLLTARERQIHQLLAEGNSNKDIARRLGLSLHTVETHRGHIMNKLGAGSVAELVLGAVRRGLVH